LAGNSIRGGGILEKNKYFLIIAGTRKAKIYLIFEEN
jgi:hypothetical protein